MFIKAVFEATFGLTDILEITFNTLNHVNITSNVRFDLIRLTSTIPLPTPHPLRELARRLHVIRSVNGR